MERCSLVNFVQKIYPQGQAASLFDDDFGDFDDNSEAFESDDSDDDDGGLQSAKYVDHDSSVELQNSVELAPSLDLSNELSWLRENDGTKGLDIGSPDDAARLLLASTSNKDFPEGPVSLQSSLELSLRVGLLEPSYATQSKIWPKSAIKFELQL